MRDIQDMSISWLEMADRYLCPCTNRSRKSDSLCLLDCRFEPKPLHTGILMITRPSIETCQPVEYSLVCLKGIQG